MKRRTEINIELSRTLQISHRHAALCECAVSAAQGQTIAPAKGAVLADINPQPISESSEANQAYLIENADSGEAIEIESAEGQLILAAAVRSLEQRLSAEGRAALSVPPAPTAARRSRISRSYAKLRWLTHTLIHPKSPASVNKEN